MANPTNWKAAQAKAAGPEARAKAAATMKRKREEREAAAEAMKKRVQNHPANVAALLKHAKITKKKGRPKKVQSIPLDMIPDAPYRKKTKPWSLKKLRQQESEAATRQEVVLALLKYLNGE